MNRGALPEEALDAVLASIPAALFVTRRHDGRILYANPRARVVLDLGDRDLVAQPMSAVDRWADPAQRSELLARLEAEGPIDAFPARMSDHLGRVRDVLSSVASIRIGAEDCLITVAYDITERTAAEDALRRSEGRLRRITESIDEGFLLVSFQPFRVHYASPAYADLLGLTLDQVYGDEQALRAVVDEEDRAALERSVGRLRAGQRVDEVEIRVVRDGELRWLRFRWSIVDDEGPDVVAAVIEDITERRRSEAELRRARARAEEANLAKSSFLSRVSHELRTPLNVILGFGQLLEGEDLDPTQQDAVREIMGAGRHLLHLVDEVLEISRAEAGGLDAADEEVAVDALVATVVAAHAPHARRHGVVVERGPEVGGSVRADRRLLDQALSHLVENAIVHNHEGGSVTVACEERPGDRLRIVVEDTGPGLSPEELERVYAPFARTPGTTGTGLGLALARHLVEAMGGELGARSVPGRGSRFWLDLDRVPVEHPPVARPEASGPRRVLYVEDNASNAELAARALATVPDLELVVAARGADGLAALAGSPFDLVLLDLHLPDMGGEEVLDHIRRHRATEDLPVVVISADASPEVIARVRASGADDYLTKPVSIPRLVRVVDAGSRRRPTTARPAASPPAPAPLPAGGGVLDHAVLDELRVLEEVEPGTLRDVVELFAGSGAERVTAMATAGATGDTEALARLAHALRGSGANLGAVALAASCRSLEHAARDGGADLAARIGAVETAFAAAVDDLRRYVAEV